MKRITKRELILHCKRMDSEVCNDCEYLESACLLFYEQNGYLPYQASKKEMTEEVIEWVEIADGEQTERNC